MKVRAEKKATWDRTKMQTHLVVHSTYLTYHNEDCIYSPSDTMTGALYNIHVYHIYSYKNTVLKLPPWNRLSRKQRKTRKRPLNHSNIPPPTILFDISTKERNTHTLQLI